MKKIFSYAMMLLAGMFVFTSCEDDNDSNPTLIEPTSFVLNQPEVGSAVVDLQKSTGINLTWSQPVYTTMNAPVVATYTVQVSNTGKFTNEYDENAEDNSGADYISLPTTPTECNAVISTTEMAKCLQQLNLWPEGEVPAELDLAVRVRAAVKDASMVDHYPIISNVVNVKVAPYYIELSDAPVLMWYILGDCIGDGKWSNNGDNLGVSNFPFFQVPGYEYDKKTGAGEIKITNYFQADKGFKILREDYKWEWAFVNDENGGMKNRLGGDDGPNITPKEDGIWTITINTKDLTAKWEKYENQDVTTYSEMAIAGAFTGDDWPDAAMNPVFNTANNHLWYYVLETEGTECKFKTAGSWDTNWGSSDFPAGTGTQGGANIVVPAGKWLIMFNDITGDYYFHNMNK